MKYREFISAVGQECNGIDIKNKYIKSYLMLGYNSIPKSFNIEQGRAYAKVWATGFKAGKFITVIDSMRSFSGLVKKVANK